MSISKKSILFTALLLGLLSCKSEYQKMKEEAEASGVVAEDLFLDLRFGMGRKEFYGTCWEHNKNGLLVNGPHHLQILYHPEMPSGKEVNMFFYPDFEEDKLFFMPIEFIYVDWFPTNAEYANDKLLEDVVGLFEKWYGAGFKEISNKDKTVRAMVKIDGNRLIRIFIKDIKTVRAELLDLRVKDITEMNKTSNEASQ
jgi:hypothetical protein